MSEHSHLIFKPSPIHGTGVFAAAAIPAETRILEYVGEKIDKQESLRRCELNNEYIFAIDPRFDLDGNVAWNPARFVNHSCDPNCDAELIEGRIWIVARRRIEAEEELTFNYGYDFENYREHPCRCGATRCCGYILAGEYSTRIPKLNSPTNRSAVFRPLHHPLTTDSPTH